MAGGFLALGDGLYSLIWEFEITNGRDIEGLSLARKEREVALLPGAEFAYGAIEVLQAGKKIGGMKIPWRLRIKAKQVK
ncbi:MAG TPA: hypothetical protein VGG09_15085 [Acidimicrobiales bacterium]